MDAARAYLLYPSAEDCQQLGIENDDWPKVKFQDFFFFCSELFNVLLIPGKDVLADSVAEDEDYGRRNHDKKLQSLRRAMQTPEQIRKTKARVMCVVDEIIRIHEIGIPKVSYDKAYTKTHRGCDPDTTLTCSERVLKVIELAKNSKHVACDIIEGKINDLVLSPLYCIGRKHSNLKTNARRSQQIAISRDLQKGGDVSSMGGVRGKGKDKESQQNGQSVLQAPLHHDIVGSRYVRQPGAVRNSAAGLKRVAYEDVDDQHAVDKRARTDGNKGGSIDPNNFRC